MIISSLVKQKHHIFVRTSICGNFKHCHIPHNWIWIVAFGEGVYKFENYIDSLMIYLMSDTCNIIAVLYFCEKCSSMQQLTLGDVQVNYSNLFLLSVRMFVCLSINLSVCIFCLFTFTLLYLNQWLDINQTLHKERMFTDIGG